MTPKTEPKAVNEDNKMLQIMKMVSDNSQLALVNALLMEIDVFRIEPIFVQLVHNTDDDSLNLLVIKDPATMKIKEISIARINSSNRILLQERYGFSNKNIVTSVYTFFLSLEFRGLLKEILLGGL